MKILNNLVLVIIVCLAATAGLAKVALMPPEIELFGEFGFNNHALMAFGVTQLIASLIVLFAKTRALGAILIITTFLVSAVALISAGSALMAGVTMVFSALACLLIWPMGQDKQSK